VGGQTAIPVDVRVIAASNRSPGEALAEGKLRRDLYYRLKVVEIHIPPLRDRIEDLEDLAAHLVREINSDEGKEVEGLDVECVAALRRYSWPGNVRELRNAIHQAVITSERGLLTISDLPYEIYNGKHKEDSFVVRIGTTMDAVKYELALKTLDAFGGNHVRASRILGISTHTLYDLLRKKGVPPRRNRNGPPGRSPSA
jgi:transcriptional regulator with PAS, ATPase and Fis domain